MCGSRDRDGARKGAAAGARPCPQRGALAIWLAGVTGAGGGVGGVTWVFVRMQR